MSELEDLRQRVALLELVNTQLSAELRHPSRRPRVLSWRERGVRWRDEDFEMRCDDCARRSDAAGMYWPLTLEFWNPALGLSRCRACWRAYSRRKARERRTIEEVHQKTLEYARRYREKNREIIKIRNRRYSKEKRERLKKKREDLVRSA